jgi:DNA-directed RNA polymerase subunit RPC12/RpoP
MESVDVDCRSCGATLTLEAHLRTAECPYCASPAVVERPSSAERPDPTFAIGFVIDQERASNAVRAWISGRGPFVRSGFKKATISKTRGVYLPAYLYGAVAETTYDAAIGENYTEVETYRDSKGNTKTRVVTKTEHRHLSGRQGRYLLDVLVTASRGIPNEELEAIEPFDLRALRRYSSALVSGWIAEEPSLTREQCLTTARDESVARIGNELSDFMPGDSHRSLTSSTHLKDEVNDLVLLPVWVFSARYAVDKPPVRILVNGQTGEVHGKVTLSAAKILAAVALALGIGALGALLAWALGAF